VILTVTVCSMRHAHSALATHDGSFDVTNCWSFDILRAEAVTLRNEMSSKANLKASVTPAVCRSEKAGSARGSVADRIGDFLDGRTYGEDLFHELYDHILAEPIPQRMRALLRKS
jgi:hypothetical protein